MSYPKIIQGGMGFGISGWPLARAVSTAGQLGTVTLVGADIFLARNLQKGDLLGDFRRALAHFPFPHIAERVLKAFYVKGGIPEHTRYKGKPFFTIAPQPELIALTVCASFVLVYLAKEGHTNPVSANLMEKIALPIPCLVLGGMLAGVDFLTVGAGIPRQIPDLIDAIAEGRPIQYNVEVVGIDGKVVTRTLNFDSKFKETFGSELPPMKKPGFIPIVASNALALTFAKKYEGRVAGLVIEGPTAGGHNAPPRTPGFNEHGEPTLVYGEKDVVDYKRVAELGVPFWIAGSFNSRERLDWAISRGAKGVQLGSIFATCEQSSMDPTIRQRVIERGSTGELKVRTDERISPTGYPFQVAELEGTISEASVYAARERVCSQCVLATLYEKPDGSIGYRCPAEPVEKYESKGGDPKDTVGRGCLCSGLLATAGLGDPGEPPVVTIGKDLSHLRRLKSPYSAQDAINLVLGAS